MIRYTTFGAALLALAMTLGCDRSPTEAQNDAREAQRRADEQAAEARRRAEEAAASAQAKADEEAKKAEQALVKARNEFRAQAERDLNDLSAEIDELKVKAVKAKGKTKAELEVALAKLDDQRNALRRDIDVLAATTAKELEDAKIRLAQSFASLKKSLSDASKIPNDTPKI